MINGHSQVPPFDVVPPQATGQTGVHDERTQSMGRWPKSTMVNLKELVKAFAMGSNSTKALASSPAFRKRKFIQKEN